MRAEETVQRVLERGGDASTAGKEVLADVASAKAVVNVLVEASKGSRLEKRRVLDVVEAVSTACAAVQESTVLGTINGKLYRIVVAVLDDPALRPEVEQRLERWSKDALFPTHTMQNILRYVQTVEPADLEYTVTALFGTSEKKATEAMERERSNQKRQRDEIRNDLRTFTTREDQMAGMMAAFDLYGPSCDPAFNTHIAPLSTSSTYRVYSFDDILLPIRGLLDARHTRRFRPLDTKTARDLGFELKEAAMYIIKKMVGHRGLDKAMGSSFADLYKNRKWKRDLDTFSSVYQQGWSAVAKLLNEDRRRDLAQLRRDVDTETEEWPSAALTLLEQAPPVALVTMQGVLQTAALVLLFKWQPFIPLDRIRAMRKTTVVDTIGSLVAQHRAIHVYTCSSEMERVCEMWPDVHVHRINDIDALDQLID